jgi:two-component system LytT family response regulator
MIHLTVITTHRETPVTTVASPYFDPPPAVPAAARRSVPVHRIAVRTRDRIVIVPTSEIVRIDAEGNYVRLWAGERSWLHKDTLSALTERLDSHEFLRVHRSHTVGLRAVRELLPRVHGEFRIRLADGTELTSGRMYRDAIRAAFGLA